MGASEVWYEPANVVILTGAGFTKTFGGYLAKEMWPALFNQPEIQADSELRECMLSVETLSFESIYEEIMESGKYNHNQKSGLTSALRRVYDEMDNNICQGVTEWVEGCRFFFARFPEFVGDRQRVFFFTLNQDLFIERFYTEVGDTKTTMRLSGLQQRPEWFKFDVGFKPIGDKRVCLPDDAAVDKLKQQFWKKGTGRFMYVKLHGSWGWQSQDESDAMVIGHGKKGRIENEPLLRWYNCLFKEVLTAGKRKLIVIGYGFRDDHINEIIAKAVDENDLELHTICPMEPQEFRDHLLRAGMPVHGVNVLPDPFCGQIWKGLRSYEPCTVKELYSYRSMQIPSRGKSFFQRLGL